MFVLCENIFTKILYYVKKIKLHYNKSFKTLSKNPFRVGDNQVVIWVV
jgi:hypothetical protein